MTMGKGVVYASSTQQKLNMKISTKAEPVSVDGLMLQVLWMQYVLEEQGYSIHDNLVYQDNQSAMLLETNGCMSRGKGHSTSIYDIFPCMIILSQMRCR